MEAVLYRWGGFVFRYRLSILVAAAVVLIVTGALAVAGGRLNGSLEPRGQARQAADLVRAEIPQPGRSAFQLLFRASSLNATDAEFRADLLDAVAPLRSDPRVTRIVTPYDENGGGTDAGVSSDGRDALVTVYLRDDFATAASYYQSLRNRVHPRVLTVLATGDLAVNQNLDASLDQDLGRSEELSLPLSLLLLLIVFGTVVAALLPLGVGVFAIIGGTGVVMAMSHATDVSDLTISLISLLGLGLAIDYSLFVVSRFREELADGAVTEEALARSLASAGRAVVFSGLAVVLGLCGLLFYQGTFLPSMGTGAIVVVFFAVFYALTLLPAILALLGPRVDRLRVVRWRRQGSGWMWPFLARGIMQRPWLLVPAVAILALAGTPSLHMRFESSDLNLLPAQAEAQRANRMLVADFPDQGRAHLTVVARFTNGSPLAAENLAALRELGSSIASEPGVVRVDGVTGAQADPELVGLTVGRDIAVLDVVTRYRPESEQARGLAARIRGLQLSRGQVMVTGPAASELDLTDLIGRTTPWAVGFVMLVMYLALLVAFRSVLLPAKAVIMTALSITASFGALVWIFQDGHLKDLLGFTPTPLDPAIPVLLFCMVFGLSMDYEVMLLSRILEAHWAGADDREAVVRGLERSGRLITGAAAIMVTVFACFTVGEVVLVKAVGLGMAIAVAADATIVRCVVVPALMRLLGRANWWAPWARGAADEPGDDGRRLAPRGRSE